MQSGDAHAVRGEKFRKNLQTEDIGRKTSGRRKQVEDSQARGGRKWAEEGGFNTLNPKHSAQCLEPASSAPRPKFFILHSSFSILSGVLDFRALSLLLCFSTLTVHNSLLLQISSYPAPAVFYDGNPIPAANNVPEDGRGLSSDLFRAQGFTAHSERGGSAHLIKSFLMRDPLGILR